MAFDVTGRARSESEQLNKRPNIVLEVEGLPDVYGTIQIKKFVRIGDPGLEVGNDWTIGGFNVLDNSEAFISYDQGTTTTITQSLNQDKGAGETVVRFQVALVDKNQEFTNIIAPGNVVADLLGRKAKIWFGFENSAFKEDYIVVMRGIIDRFDAGSGLVTMSLSSPDQLKRQTLFLVAESAISSQVLPGDSVVNVADASDFLVPVTGPDGTVDADFKTYIKVNSELIRYEAVSSNQFQTLTRGELETTAGTHEIGDTVQSFIRLGAQDVMTLALKVMLSGKEGPYIEDEEMANFVRTTGTDTVANSMFIKELDLEKEFNVIVGDFVTTTGAANAANNVTNKEIVGITVTNDGTVLIIGDVSFVEEISTTAVYDIRSQFDVWPTGAGLALDNDFVDIKQHLEIRSFFLSSTEMDLYIEKEIEGKTLLTDQIYNPVSCFSIPRKAQASVGIHRPPLPNQNIKTLNGENVLNANKLKVERSINKNFFNSIIYKFEVNSLDTTLFQKGLVRTNATSLTRIPIGNKSLTINSIGMREGLSASLIADEATERRLNKYKFGAEFLRQVSVNTKTGFDVEIGDAVVLDYTALQLSDSKSGTRAGESRLFEIINKKFNTKTGKIDLDILDSNADANVRYGLISPCSLISSGISTTQFIIKPSFNTDEFGVNEFRKWDNLQTATVLVRSEDYTVTDTAQIKSISGNTFTLETPLSFTPLTDYVVELDIYDNQSDDTKLLYVFMSDAAFGDGGVQYSMI